MLGLNLDGERENMWAPARKRALEEGTELKGRSDLELLPPLKSHPNLGFQS